MSGAVFEVVRKATNKVVGTITTDADGNAEVGNLLRDTYILRETTAPAGYDRLTEDITISPTDFGKTLNVGSPASGDSGDSRLVAVNVVNKQAQTPTDKQVTFSKVNLAGEEIAGAQIQIFKGRESKGSPVASWTSEADKSKEINLEPGVYTFHEEAAPTGYLAVTDIIFQVNEDSTVTVLDANSNAVEYTDGKLFITDQAAPSEPGTPDKAVQGGIKPNQSSDSGATSPSVDAEASPADDTDDPLEERPRPFSEAPSLAPPFAGSAWVPRPLCPSSSAGREASEASSAPGLGTAFRPGRAARAARKSTTSPPPAGAGAPPAAWPPWEVP
ncbi:MAG: prealbumin-like fold domain-containing protein [Lautropia mirabilis]